MINLSKPEVRTEENGILYLSRTAEQVKSDLQRILEKFPNWDDSFAAHWRKILSAKVPICPACGEPGGPLRKTAEGKVLGCDRCLVISGYYEFEPGNDLIGLKEAAEILGWDPRKVATYRARGSFPEPIAELAAGPVWQRKQIEDYKKAKQARE